VRNIADLYKLRPRDIIDFEGMGEKSAANVIEAIRGSRNKPLWRLLAGLGIRHIGGQTAQTLAEYFGTLDKALSIKREDLQKLKKQERDKKKLLTEKRGRGEISEPEYTKELEVLQENECLRDVGDEMTKSFCDYIEMDKNKAVLKELISLGVNPKETHLQTQLGELAGKTVVVTGTLEHFTRQQIEEVLRQAGAKAASSVSRNTDFVLAGENPGSKLEKAEQLGIEIIDEDQFIQRIQHKSQARQKNIP
jgi:DNA ligase (NAD+)